MGLHLKEALRTLCCNNGWSYAVVWRLKCRDSMLLIPFDAYCGAESGMVGDLVLHQVHVVGEGAIGQVALNGRHRWIFADTYSNEQSTYGSLDGQIVFQDTAEWNFQFSAGIKTVAIISVSSQRVIQFGSNQKIPESLEFVENIKCFFHHHQGVLGTAYENLMKPIDGESFSQSRSYASSFSSGNPYSNYANAISLRDDSCKELAAKILQQSSNNLTSSLCIQSANPHTSTRPAVSATTSAKSVAPMTNSVHLLNCGRNAGANAQVILSKPNKPPQILQHSNFSSPSSSLLCNSSRGEVPPYKCTEHQLLSENGTEGSSFIFPSDSHFCVSSDKKLSVFEGLSFTTSLCGSEGSLSNANHCVAGSVYAGKTEADNQRLPFFHTTEGTNMSDAFFWDSKPNIAGLSLPSLTSINQLDQSSLLQEHMSTDYIAPPSSDISQLACSLESDPLRRDIHKSNQVNNLCSTLQGLVACCSTSQRSCSDGKQSISNIPFQRSAENNLFDGFGLESKQNHEQKYWENIVLPEGIGDCPPFSSGASECFSNVDIDSATDCDKGFFSDSSLEQLLDAVVGSAKSVSNTTNQSSISTVTRSGSSYAYSEQAPFVGLSGLSGGTDALLYKAHSSCGTNKDVLSKSLVSSWIESSNNLSAESAIISQPKKPEDPSKCTRKRARPGESTRPRPKDRQQIQDRVKELREIVPNGAKCSIDSLLDRTIKHMLFLQGVTKYADKLKLANEPKKDGGANGVAFKDNSSGNGGGATWAFEVGGQTMVCPITVEDLDSPGQMLVEMLCEERGFFLEIADTVRGYGLTILKGIMEVRDDKVWAQFVVEAKGDITRMDVFMFLINFLQQTMETSISSSGQPTKIMDSSIPAFNNNLRPPLPHPISIAARMH